MSESHCRNGLPRSRARRDVLAAGAGLALSLIVRPAAAEDLAAAIAAFTGGAPVRPGKVKLEIPALVENGNTVPITVSVDSPMTVDDRVATIAIFNEKNPQRGVAVFSLGPRAARPSVSTRIRLATSQKLIAVARMSDGALLVGDGRRRRHPRRVHRRRQSGLSGESMARTLIKVPLSPKRGDIDRDPHADRAPDGNRLSARCGGTEAAARHHAALLLPLQRGARVQRRASSGDRRQPVPRVFDNRSGERHAHLHVGRRQRLRADGDASCSP